MPLRKQAIYNQLLVLRCQRSDKKAFEELVRNWEKPLFYYVKRLIDSEQEAWNILQETWLKVIQSIKKLREPQNLPCWLYSIARRTAMSHLRSKYRKQVLNDIGDGTLPTQENNEQLLFESAEQVRYALGKISLPHREVLTLFFLQDLSIEQIGQVVRIPAGTVKSRLHYAKHALKAVLEKEQNHE